MFPRLGLTAEYGDRRADYVELPLTGRSNVIAAEGCAMLGGEGRILCGKVAKRPDARPETKCLPFIIESSFSVSLARPPQLLRLASFGGSGSRCGVVCAAGACRRSSIMAALV